MTAEEDLRSLLVRRIRREGPITFAAFMAEALYHPRLGRYSSSRPPMGTEGDYITSPEVDEAFGRLVGRAVADMASRIPPAPGGQGGTPFTVVEAGPGRGSLARDLLLGVREEFPALASRLRYVLVESSESLRSVQRSVLSEAGVAERAQWAAWKDLLRAKPITGCLLANEFLDALPVHLVEFSEGSLREVYVAAAADGSLHETLGEPSSEEVACYFNDLGVRLEEGQRAEVNLAALDWIADAACLLESGYVVIIDYGHEAVDLYSERRYAGTLVGYRRHQLVVDLLANPGEQDLTSHLDFTSLARDARKHGFAAAPLTSQRNFLVSMGLAHMIAAFAEPREGMEEGERLSRRFALHALMSPSGMGSTFKVLVLARRAPIDDLACLVNPFRV